MCIPCHNVTFGGSDGRRPIFWDEEEPDEAYIICDGGGDDFGGVVPDMRDRMVLGTSDTHPAGTIGGSTEIDLTGLSVGSTTLTTEQMPYHNHSLYTGYFHDSQEKNRGGNTSARNSWYATEFAGSSGGHTHAISGSVSLTESFPPFYVLAYVVFVSTI